MGYNKNVEFIPWIHFETSWAHYSVLEYIKKMKKNSSLGLEISPLELKTYKEIIDKNKKGINVDSILFRIQDKGGRLYISKEALNVISYCEKNNITIVPLLKTTDTYKQWSQTFKPETKDGSQKIIQEMDKVISSEIINYLTTKDNLFVLIGASHVLGTQAGLINKFKIKFNHKFNLNEKINLSIFSSKQREIMNNFLKESHNYFYKGGKLTIGLNELEAGFNTEVIQEKLFQELIGRKSIEENRALRKKMERVIKDSNISLKKKKLGISVLRKHMTPKPK